VEQTRPPAACQAWSHAAASHGPALQDLLGVGLDFGRVFVGNVGGGGEVRDFTALGDAVNTAARLQGAAGPGQIVMSERVYASVAAAHPDAQSVELELKGKSASVRARVVDVGRPVTAEAKS
jgi:adenylate cyclase